MKKITIKIFHLLTLSMVILLLSCKTHDEQGPGWQAENALRAIGEIGMYSGSKKLLGFDENKQVYLRQKPGAEVTFRIQSMDRAQYATVSFEYKENYQIGSSVNVDIVSEGYPEVVDAQIAMKVLRIENGTLWLIENRSTDSPLGIVALWQ